MGVVEAGQKPKLGFQEIRSDLSCAQAVRYFEPHRPQNDHRKKRRIERWPKKNPETTDINVQK